MFGSVQITLPRRYTLAIFPSMAEGRRMKVAVLFSIPKTTSGDCCWRWRSVDGITDSKQSFNNYEDCAENARMNGYLYHHIPNTTANRATFNITGRFKATKQ
jgi:hypothetical protein